MSRDVLSNLFFRPLSCFLNSEAKNYFLCYLCPGVNTLLVQVAYICRYWIKGDTSEGNEILEDAKVTKQLMFQNSFFFLLYLLFRSYIARREIGLNEEVF